MALNPLNTALNLVQLPFRLTQKALGSVLGGGEPQQEEPPEVRREKAQPKDLDDATIARKVESELFRDRRIAKSKVNVNVVERVVWIRGQARTPELIKLAERRASSVPEVTKVENLLHLPKTPAPSRTDTPARQRKTQRSPKDESIGRGTPTETTEEERTAEAEPAPDELAARGEGRQPAPLGSPKDESIGRGTPTETTEEERTAEAEPAPDELAARGEGRQPAPLGSPKDESIGRGTPTETTEEERTADAEPAPDELAARGEGRQPAPLGQNENSGESG